MNGDLMGYRTNYSQKLDYVDYVLLIFSYLAMLVLP
jgi:hypothetical protein